MANPWFRMYSEFLTDPKVQMLSEADQRRFIMLLCMCCKENRLAHDDAEVAFSLRITDEEWAKSKATFIGKGLLNEDGAVANWEKRQHFTGNGTPTCTSKNENYIYFVAPTSQAVDSVGEFVVKIGISKNPWARLKELQTGNHEKLHIAAKFRADTISDAEIHTLLGQFRTAGEWFSLPARLKSTILSKDSKGMSYVELRRKIAEMLRSHSSSTTDTDTDTESDTENNKKTKQKKSKPDSWKRFFDAYPENKKGGTDAAAWKAALREGLEESDFEAMAADVEKRKRLCVSWYSTYALGITRYISERFWLTPITPEIGLAKIGNSVSPPRTRDIPLEQQLNDRSWAGSVLQGEVIRDR